MSDSLILFGTIFSILILGLLIGLILENRGMFKIPEDEVMARYIRLEKYRSDLRKKLNKNEKI